MRKKRAIWGILGGLLLMLAACGGNEPVGNPDVAKEAQENYSIEEEMAMAQVGEISDAGIMKAIIFTGGRTAVTEKRFFSETVYLEILAPEGA